MTFEDKGDDTTLIGWVAAGAFVALTGLGLLLTSGCGGASDALRAAYATEAARCVMNERAIVDRQGTTEEQDRADLDAERARCDAALDAIEETP
jgi:hypothetical protein